MGWYTKAKIHRYCDNLNLDDEVGIPVNIEPCLEIFVEYFYLKTFNKFYNELSWYLESGARELVKNIEDKYLHNEIDEFALLHDSDFIEFISNRAETITYERLEEELDYFKDECLDVLDSLDIDELEDFISDWGPYISLSVEYQDMCVDDDIDVQEYLEMRLEDEE